MRQTRARKPDVEKLAAEARAKREQACDKAIQAVLSQHNCQMSVVVRRISAVETDPLEWMPLGAVLGLPHAIFISSK